MSKLTSVPCAGVDRLAVKVAVVVPLLPSATDTSLIVRFGGAAPEQLLVGELELRGDAANVKKSAALSFMSVQPPAFLNAEFTLLGAAVGPVPSKQKSVVPVDPPYPTSSRMLALDGQAPA